MKSANDIELVEHLRQVKRQSTDLDMHTRDEKHDKLIRCLLNIRNSADEAIKRLLKTT